MLFQQWHFWGFLQTSEVLKTTTCFSPHETMSLLEQGIRFSPFKDPFKSLLPGREWRAAPGPSVPPTRRGEAALCRARGLVGALWGAGLPHLPCLGRKSHNNPRKQRPLVLRFRPSLPGRARCSCLAFSEPEFSPNPEGAQRVGGGRGICSSPLFPCPAPPSFAECFFFSCFESGMFCCGSCGCRGQPKGRRRGAAVQLAADCCPGKAECCARLRTEGPDGHGPMLCPFRHPEASRCSNTAAGIAAGAAASKALSGSQVLGWAEKKQRN